MFTIFKKKSEIDVLNERYRELLAEAHALSHRDRKAGDAKLAEAEEIALKIESLKAKS